MKISVTGYKLIGALTMSMPFPNTLLFIRSPKELALLVVNQRKKLKLSQGDVADLVGLKQKTISAFENKPEGTKLNTLFLILSAVKLDVSILAKDKSTATQTQWKEEW